MQITKFEDLIAWQKAQDIAFSIHIAFRSSKEFSFKDQIFRAAISISNNIAEGFERNNNKEFARLLKIAKGSCGEVRSMIYLAKKINFIDAAQLDDFLNSC